MWHDASNPAYTATTITEGAIAQATDNIPNAAAAERSTILHMLAKNRLSAEEANALLEASMILTLTRI